MIRYDLNPATRLADVALVVLDGWQGKRVGTALFRRLLGVARARGVTAFTADVLCTNARMLRIFEKSGLRVTTELAAGVYGVTALFDHDRVPLPEG